MAKTMWATLASLMTFFFWLSPLQSLGFNHTLKPRKKKEKKKEVTHLQKKHLKPIGFFFLFFFHQITTMWDYQHIIYL